MNSDIFLTLYTKVNLKWIKDLNLRAKTIKKKKKKTLLEENRGVNLYIHPTVQMNFPILLSPREDSPNQEGLHAGKC